jgi:hypothetical protein
VGLPGAFGYEPGRETVGEEEGVSAECPSRGGPMHWGALREPDSAASIMTTLGR